MVVTTAASHQPARSRCRKLSFAQQDPTSRRLGMKGWQGQFATYEKLSKNVALCFIYTSKRYKVV